MSNYFIPLIAMLLGWQIEVFSFVPLEEQQLEFYDKILLPLEQKVIRPQLIPSNTNQQLESFQQQTQIKKDLKNDEIRLITGNLGRLNSKHSKLTDYSSFALDFIKQHKNIFKVSPLDLRLNQDATFIGKDVQFIKFDIYRENIQILDAEINFRFKQQRLVQVVNYSYSELTEKPDLLLDQKEITEIVYQVSRSYKMSKSKIFYRVKEEPKGYSLVKVSHVDVSTKQYKHISVQVDHTNGEVYEIRDHLYYLDGVVKADLYPRWYEENLQAAYLEHLNVTLDSGVVVTGPSGAFEAPENSNPRIEQGLKGSYVSVRDVKGHPIDQAAQVVNNSWLLHVEKPQASQENWIGPTLAQNMAFHHVNKIVEHAKNYIDSSWFDVPLQANTNLRSTCNAHWDGRTINFYSGNSRCANTALISDVIYHEWGHGLDANTGGIQDGAFSEGLGDIVSLIMNQSNLLGIGFMVEGFAPVRDLEPDKTYPQDRGGVHAEGLIIGSTFWDLYKAFKEKYDETQSVDFLSRFVFHMVYTARTYLDVYDAILVIDDDDDDLLNGTPHKCLINKVFAKHGLAEEDIACMLAVVEGVTVLDSDEDQIIEPGESIQLHMLAKNPSDNLLEELKGNISIEEDFEGIIVEHSGLLWGPMETGESSLSTVPAVISLSDDVACGTEFTTKVHLYSDTREAFYHHKFLVGINDGTTQTYPAQGLPIPILDRQEISADLEVSSSDWDNDTLIHRAHLKFDIRHTYIGDLTVSLRSPGGELVQIYKGQGGSDDVHYDQDITEHVGNTRGRGTWSIVVRDNAQRDEGFLDSFELTLTPAAFRCE
jgi:subtilisin-like proprotein convertase family protein